MSRFASSSHTVSTLYSLQQHGGVGTDSIVSAINFSDLSSKKGKANAEIVPVANSWGGHRFLGGFPTPSL